MRGDRLFAPATQAGGEPAAVFGAGAGGRIG